MKLSEIVNIEELRGLCESFTALSGAVTAILDLEGNILEQNLFAVTFLNALQCDHRPPKVEFLVFNLRMAEIQGLFAGF